MRIQIILKFLAILLSFTSAYTWTTKDECPDTIKTTVSSDPCANSEYRDVYGCTKKPQFTTMDSVHDALTHCPNITALDLRVTGLGCSEWPSSWSFPTSPWGGDRYPKLTSLRVEGYDFSTRSLFSRQSNPFRNENVVAQFLRQIVSAVGMGRYSQRFVDWLPIKSKLDLWLDAMDWSGIEEIMIARITDDILKKVPPRLTSLKRLETTNMTFIEAFPNNTLTHLTWIGEPEPNDLHHILELQGTSLQSLHFRRPERINGPFLPNFNTSMLPAMAGNLSHVALNVPRNGTWPLDTLSTISSLPNLRTAEIYMNLQSECAQQRPSMSWMPWKERKNWEKVCRGEDQYQKPTMSKEGAEKMFEHMREVKNGIELRNVTFYVGDWTRPWDGPVYEPDWLEGRTGKVACSLDNDGVDGWCIVEQGRRTVEDEAEGLGWYSGW